MKSFKRLASVTAFSLIASLSVPLPVSAAWDVVGKITNIEPSYMPDMVLFKIDVGVGTCPWIWYHGNAYASTTEPKKNVQGSYALLLTALVSGKRVEVYGDNCVAENIHIIP